MDGITDDFSHIVEIKCGRSAYSQANKGKVPSSYYGQLQHRLLITGLDTVDYWCYWLGAKGILQTVNRDESYIRRLLQAEMEFTKILNG